MTSDMENDLPDKQGILQNEKETSRWDAAKLLKAVRQNRDIVHSYWPLIIVIAICAIVGSIAIVALPGREEKVRNQWRGIYHVDDGMVGFRSQFQFDISPEFEIATAITHTSDHGVWVCGSYANAKDYKIVHYSQTGEILKRIALPTMPSDILLDNANGFFADKILVAYRYGVWVYDEEGNQIQVFSAPVSVSPNQEQFISSIAVHENALYMADAMQNVIYRFNIEGKCDLVIGKDWSYNANGESFPGFDADWPYFDLAVDSNGVIWVGDTKNRRLVPFDHDGTWLSSKAWGKSGYSAESLLHGGSILPAVDEFFGNNPTSIALLNDGRFVTVERIVNQVKVFSSSGEFLTYVTPPNFFTNEAEVVFLVDKELQRKTREDSWLPAIRVDTCEDNSIVLLDQMRMKVHLFVEK